LDQFHQPDGVGAFDPNNVQALAINVRMLDTDAIYDAKIDNIYFDAPDVVVPSTEPLYGLYLSANDEFVLTDEFSLSIAPDILGGFLLSWPAQTNRVYSLQYSDGGVSDGMTFNALTNLTVPANQDARVRDTNSSPVRVYRVKVQKQ
jgi:hypothetical protein